MSLIMEKYGELIAEIIAIVIVLGIITTIGVQVSASTSDQISRMEAAVEADWSAVDSVGDATDINGDTIDQINNKINAIQSSIDSTNQNINNSIHEIYNTLSTFNSGLIAVNSQLSAVIEEAKASSTYSLNTRVKIGSYDQYTLYRETIPISTTNGSMYQFDIGSNNPLVFAEIVSGGFGTTNVNPLPYSDNSYYVIPYLTASGKQIGIVSNLPIVTSGHITIIYAE